MSRTPTLLVLAMASALAGCSAGAENGQRENEELRRMLIETRTDLEEIKRDQEQLRATVEFLQHARGAGSGGSGQREQAARWPADPWSSPDPFAGARPPADLDSLEPGQPLPTRPGLPPQQDVLGAPPPGGMLPPAAPPTGAALPPPDMPAQLPPAGSPAQAPSGPQAASNEIVAGVRGGGAWTEPGTMGVNVPPPAVPSNLSGSTYDEAVSAFNAGKYEDAIQHFRDYIHKEPQSAFADDAQFWIGESNLRKGQYSNAIKEFNQVVLRYASGDRSAASLLKLAEVFSKIGDQVDARLSLQKLVNRYPGSAEAAEAYRLLQEMGG